jgi:tRNA modification GTPase
LNRDEIHYAETICAIATPPGESAIGVIRVSGQQAFALVQSIFRGNRKLETFQSHTIHHGEIFDPLVKQVIDEALFLVMKGPRSYTGEDVVEIQSHGNPFLLQKTLSLLLAQGGRLALPGEFTRRAFLSGKIDLAQAEAVMEMISSQSAEHHQWAFSQLKGQLSHKIKGLREKLLTMLAQIEASIDFSEEGISFSTNEEIGNGAATILKELRDLLDQYEEGRQIRDGFTAVIVGRPNVGKSSLMNLLLQEDRAIVSPIPGTTRDLLQEWAQIEGILIKLVDTAGYRETTDFVELEGVRRGAEAIKSGDVALWVLDASESLQKEDELLLGRIQCKKRIIILNKTDLPRQIDLAKIIETYPHDLMIPLSTLNREGLDDLKKAVKRTLIAHPEKERPLVGLLRHRSALQRAEGAISRAVASSQRGDSWEFLAADLRGGADALGEIIGQITTDAILDEVFNQFCIGK